MRSVAWVSDTGRTIVFDSNGPLYYSDLTSSLGATSETSRAPRQNGQTTYHVSLDTPSIMFSGAMWIMGSKTKPAKAEYDRMRTFLCQIFAPNRWGTLIYYREDCAYQIRCRPIATPSFSSEVGTYATIEIDFVADSPFWEVAEEQVIDLGINLKMWHFPWASAKAPMGAFNRFARINNTTDEEIFPVVEVYTTGQHVTLTNLTTGKYIIIEHAIEDGQKLVVDLADITAFLWTQDENRDYTKSEDVSHWMSLDSEPWSIIPGQNQIAIYNDVPEDTPVAFVKYRLPAVGV